MRRFLVLLKKELRELLTPQMIVPLLVSMVVFVFIGDVVGSETEKAQGTQSVAVVDLDDTSTSQDIISVLEESGFEVTLRDAEGDSVDEAVVGSSEKTTLVITDGFEAGLARGEPAGIQVYTRVDSFSLTGLKTAGTVRAAVTSINAFLSDQLLADVAPGEDPQRLKEPVRLVEHVVVGEHSTEGPPEMVEGFIIQQSMLVPMILFVVIIFSSQMIATTIASEKENKTLETLLASPVSRGALVTAKMMAASIVALMAAVVYMFAMQRYLEGVTGGALTSGASGDVMTLLGLTLGAGDYVLVGLTLFLGILCALAIALILGSFADSVRSVGAIMAPLMVLMLVPYLLTLFLDFNSMTPALRTFVLANPFSYPFTAMPNLMLGRTGLVYWGIAYEAVWFAVFVLAAAWIFSSDRILTMRLRWGRSRR